MLEEPRSVRALLSSREKFLLGFSPFSRPGKHGKYRKRHGPNRADNTPGHLRVYGEKAERVPLLRDAPYCEKAVRREPGEDQERRASKREMSRTPPVAAEVAIAAYMRSAAETFRSRGPGCHGRSDASIMVRREDSSSPLTAR